MIMNKVIVTHISPDIDAITSCWLIKKFLPGWKNAEIKLVPAGGTFENQPVDENTDIIHVDTGFGRFDHHQDQKITSAAQKILNYLIDKKYVKTNKQSVLEKLVDYVTGADNFLDIYYPDPKNDLYDILPQYIIEGLKNIYNDDQKLITTGLLIIDIIYFNFKNKIDAEAIIESSFIFKSYWGKTIAIESNNRFVSKIAQRFGYMLAIQKYPKSGYVKIKLRPDSKKSLEKIYQKILIKDPTATWYNHRSGRMVLNGSMKHPDFKASKLSINELITLVKSIR